MCYNNIFNDNTIDLKQDENGNIRFDNKGSLVAYLNRIFNASGNLKNVKITINVNNVDTQIINTTGASNIVGVVNANNNN